MNMSRREMALGMATLAVALFGATALLVKPRLAGWRGLRAEQEGLRRDLMLDRRLVEQRAAWEERLAACGRELKPFPPDQEMDVYWLSVLDDAAKRHGLNLLRLEAGRELAQGAVRELPIECKDFEGTLDALTHFLFELQSRGAMLDVRQLFVKPKAGNVLRGRFSLSCAYTRAAGAEAPKAEAP